MAEVIWIELAITGLDRIAHYIRQFDRQAAENCERRLRQAGDSLREFPHRGRPAPQGRRELLSVWPYIIRYRVVGDTVFILDVRHMRQRKRAR